MKIDKGTRYIYADMVYCYSTIVTLTKIEERPDTSLVKLIFDRKEEREELRNTIMRFGGLWYSRNTPTTKHYLQIGGAQILLPLDKRESVKGLRLFTNNMMKNVNWDSMNTLSRICFKHYRTLLDKLKAMDYESDTE